jgi:cytochrome c biogenesis protein CcmG/thiol:disulfide interchange protein DsbE
MTAGMTVGATARLMAAAIALLAGAAAQSAPPAELKPWTGGPAPALGLKDLEGASQSLQAYRGKVVILNFWATWCEPCRDEMPSFNKLRRSFEGRPVAVLAVNVGEGEGRIGEFLRKVPVEFPVLLDRDAKASRDWKVRLMPTTFIIGRDGRVRYSYAGERDWDDATVRAKVAALAEEKTGR